MKASKRKIYTVRAQLVGEDVDDVKAAMEVMNQILHVELSHAQFVIALSRFYLKHQAVE